MHSLPIMDNSELRRCGQNEPERGRGRCRTVGQEVLRARRVRSYKLKLLIWGQAATNSTRRRQFRRCAAVGDALILAVSSRCRVIQHRHWTRKPIRLVRLRSRRVTLGRSRTRELDPPDRVRWRKWFFEAHEPRHVVGGDPDVIISRHAAYARASALGQILRHREHHAVVEVGRQVSSNASRQRSRLPCGFRFLHRG